VTKWVSGRLFTNRHKHWTIEQALHEMKTLVISEVEKGATYNKYKSYLLTPQEKTEKLSPSHVVERIQSNMVQSGMMIGIIERMGASLALLQSIIDGDGELDKSFQALNTGSSSLSKNGTSTKREPKLLQNKSKFSSTELVRMLQRDPVVFSQLQHYLRYEFQIYDFALQLHQRQVEMFSPNYSTTCDMSFKFMTLPYNFINDRWKCYISSMEIDFISLERYSRVEVLGKVEISAHSTSSADPLLLINNS
jgi:hypothetical protein